jgi:hypothetical protein
MKTTYSLISLFSATLVAGTPVSWSESNVAIRDVSGAPLDARTENVVVAESRLPIAVNLFQQ